MILDNIKTFLPDYANMGCKLATALDWLKNNDLKAIKPNQVVTIDGNRVLAQIQEYDTVDAKEALFETHRSFIDIQIVVGGREIIYWTPASRLTSVKTAYNPEKDIAFFEEPAVSVPLRLEEGDFAVFFPSDGHKTRCFVSEPMRVNKIVVKVSV